MKKALVFVVALVFVAGLGAVYAAEFNGITDFSGRAYDRFDIETGDSPGTVYESTAPGSKRVVEDFNTTGKSYDTFEIEMIEPEKRVKEGAAPGSLRNMKRNYAGKESSVKAYDTFEIEMLK